MENIFSSFQRLLGTVYERIHAFKKKYFKLNKKNRVISNLQYKGLHVQDILKLDKTKVGINQCLADFDYQQDPNDNGNEI